MREASASKRIKSFCVAQPMQKLGWTECGSGASSGALWNFQWRASAFGARRQAQSGVGGPGTDAVAVLRRGNSRRMLDLSARRGGPGRRRAIAGRGMAGACANEGWVGCCGREGSRSAGLLGVEATDANEMASFAAWADARFCGLAVAGRQIGGVVDRLGRSCHWRRCCRPLKKQEQSRARAACLRLAGCHRPKYRTLCRPLGRTCCRKRRMNSWPGKRLVRHRVRLCGPCGGW